MSVSNPYSAEFAVQRDNTTALNRYPEIFEIVKGLCQKKSISKPRILSFGCSSGDEPYTLGRDYFPDAKIVGLDISEKVLDIAKRERNISGITTYDLSTPESLKDYGPYDIIFAMSVLCRWPDFEFETNSNRLFPFHQYESVAGSLHNVLKLGGILAIYNANYALSDSNLINCYQIVLDSRLKSNGYVKHFDMAGRAIPDYSGTESVYVKTHDDQPLQDSINLNFINADGALLGVIRATRFRALI